MVSKKKELAHAVLFSVLLSPGFAAESEEGEPHLLAVASGRSDPVAQVGRQNSLKAHELTERTEEIHRFSITTLVSSTCQKDGSCPVSHAQSVRSGVDAQVADARNHQTESGHGLTWGKSPQSA